MNITKLKFKENKRRISGIRFLVSLILLLLNLQKAILSTITTKMKRYQTLLGKIAGSLKVTSF